MVASAIFYGVVCWGSSVSSADRKRLNRLVKKATSVLGCPHYSVEVVGERRMMAKLSSLMENMSHPMQDTLTTLGSSFSNRLLHLRCVKERYCRSFLPAAVRLYIQHCSQQTTHTKTDKFIHVQYICIINGTKSTYVQYCEPMSLFTDKM